MRLPAILLPGLLAVAAKSQQWSFLAGPTIGGRSAAYDLHRSRLVAFGVDGGTWEYDGGRPLCRPPGTVPGGAPPPRAMAAMTYDVARRHVLMFGGEDVNGLLRDTWAWDGNRWRQLGSTLLPPSRSDAAMTFDIARSRVVMFGGRNSAFGAQSDTWEHDGSQWIRCAPATVPTVATGPVMAFHLARGVAVMVTHPGRGAAVQTWEWNGVDWSQRPSAAAPSTIAYESMAYDLVRQRTVLLGGLPSGSEVWEWDGTTWTLTPVIVPKRMGAVAWFDPALGRVVQLGGADVRQTPSGGTAGQWHTDAWAWTGGALTPVHDDHRPPSRFGQAWFADPLRGRLVLFGGAFDLPLDDTWTWDGIAWTRMSPANRPPARQLPATTFDWTRGHGLMFGGIAMNQWRNDLWAWTGSDWVALPSTGGPDARDSAGLACDVARGTVVLFGGMAGSLASPNAMRGDTWEWNGTIWTQRQPAVSPSPREGPAMTYDLARGRVVLFGGRDFSVPGTRLNDTWEWDGTSWRLVQPAVTPPTLADVSLNYDPVRARVILTGTWLDGWPWAFQVWEYDGFTWTPSFTAPEWQLAGRTVMDLVRNRLVVVTNSSTQLAELAVQLAQADPFGGGCGAPVPVLGARTRPRIGEPEFGLETLVGAGQAVVFALATGQGSTPLGNGCSLLLAQVGASALAVARTNGLAVQPIPIPFATSLRGLVLFGQAGAFDPAAPGGIRLTQGLRITIGD